MSESTANNLVIAISSRALFDLADAHQIYEKEGLEAYSDFQISKEEEVLLPGQAFPMVKKLLALNELLPATLRIEVILLSRNSADTGLRVFNSIEHYDLKIKRAAFCGGESPWRYIEAFGCQLFLSNEGSDVRIALENGIAAATLISNVSGDHHDNQLRFAFDGDAVLFSDESERIFKTHGLDAFSENEDSARKKPMEGGPFKDFLGSLQKLQRVLPFEKSPIRTALITARSAPAHERVIRTLRTWDIRIDESIFLGGLAKTEFLKAYGADVFFDDQQSHCRDAADSVPTGHVPHGVANSE